MRAATLVVPALALVLATGCAAAKATYQMVDAEKRLKRAEEAHAPEYALYEYTMAARFVEKAREQAGYSEFKSSVLLSKASAQWSDRAVIVVQRSGMLLGELGEDEALDEVPDNVGDELSDEREIILEGELEPEPEDAPPEDPERGKLPEFFEEPDEEGGEPDAVEPGPGEGPASGDVPPSDAEPRPDGDSTPEEEPNPTPQPEGL